MGCSPSKYSSFRRGIDDPLPIIEKRYRQGKRNDGSRDPPGTLDALDDECNAALRTGDVLLMHCTHTFGKLTQTVTRNPWDHVGIIVRLDDKEAGGTTAVEGRIALLAENPIPDVLSGEDMPEDVVELPRVVWQDPRAGQVTVLEAMGVGSFAYPNVSDHFVFRGDFYKYVAVRKLRDADGNPLGPAACAQIEAFVRKIWARPYEGMDKEGLSELIRPVVKGDPKHAVKDKDKEALDKLFCSELVAETLQVADVLPENSLNSNELLPHMFAPGQAVDKFLRREKHTFRLGEIEILKAPGTALTNEIRARRRELVAAAAKK